MPADVVRAVNNPAAPDQCLVLWGNGRIDAFNVAQPTGFETWYDRLDMPVAVAIAVLDWTDEPAGYVLDVVGGLHEFGGLGDAPAGPPYDEYRRRYVDLTMNPSGTGEGYALDYWGTVYAFGGAPAATGAPTFTSPHAKRLVVDWTNPGRRGYILDILGGIHEINGAVEHGDAPYWAYDAARDLVITSWSAGTGLLLDYHGGVHPVGAEPRVYGYPYWEGGDVARALFKLGTDPSRFAIVDMRGRFIRFTSSTAPTLLLTGPADPITTTTRPTVTWEYADAQNDRQNRWQVGVFTTEQVEAAGRDTFDPIAYASQALATGEGTDQSQRGFVPTVDLPNGELEAWSRAQDTAGQWSAWAVQSWTQNVVPPAAPTLDATVNGLDVDLVATFSVSPGARPVRFEYLAADGTWQTVRGADAVVASGTVATATDHEAPVGVARSYRAWQYQVSPMLAGVASNIDTVTLAPGEGIWLSTLGPAATTVPLAVAALSWSRPVRGGAFTAVDREDPIVISGPRPRYRRGQLDLTTADRASAKALLELLTSGQTLLYRDQWGEVAFVRVAPGSSLDEEFVVAAPSGADIGQFEVGYRHARTVQVVEVRRPPVVVDSNAPTMPAARSLSGGWGGTTITVAGFSGY